MPEMMKCNRCGATGKPPSPCLYSDVPCEGRMQPAHSCHMPLPIPALGMHWHCPDCGDGWYVTDKGWISGAHWERITKEAEEHAEHILTYVRDQGFELQPWQERIIRGVAYQYLNGNPNRGSL